MYFMKKLNIASPLFQNFSNPLPLPAPSLSRIHSFCRFGCVCYYYTSNVLLYLIILWTQTCQTLVCSTSSQPMQCVLCNKASNFMKFEKGDMTFAISLIWNQTQRQRDKGQTGTNRVTHTHTHTHTHTRTHMFKRILLLSVETTSIPMCHVLWEQFGCFCICIQWVQWLYFVVTHLNISIVFAWVIFFQ